MGASKQLPEIDEKQVRALATDKSFERGYEYLQAGAVQRVVLRGNLLFAEVEGSEYDPYRVTVELSKKRIAKATCACPYEFGGICKHIVATLLAYIQTPEEIEHRQPTGELIGRLSPEQLRDLILVLVQEQPQLMDVIDEKLLPGC